MRTLFFLLLSWAASQPYATAQTRAAGPWRVTYPPTRERVLNEWSSQYRYADTPFDTARFFAIKAGGTPFVDSQPFTDYYRDIVFANTATRVVLPRKLSIAPWNASPDSIILFLHCTNPLLAPAPSRGKQVPIYFTATGATLRLDRKQERLLLVPKDTVVILRAYQGTKRLFSHKFRASFPPPPTLKCFAPPCGVGCKPSYTEYLRTITLKAIPAIDFAEMMPEDARYRVARFRATLLRQGKAVELGPGQLAEKTVQGPQGDMSDLTSTSQLGDQLRVDVLLVQRLNALGIVTEVPVTQRFIINGLRCHPEQ